MITPVFRHALVHPETHPYMLRSSGLKKLLDSNIFFGSKSTNGEAQGELIAAREFWYRQVGLCPDMKDPMDCTSDPGLGMIALLQFLY